MGRDHWPEDADEDITGPHEYLAFGSLLHP
jgi:hypothetical protein